MKSLTLEGKFIRLVPLSTEHKEGLCAAISDGELWTLHVTIVPHINKIDAFFSAAQKAYESGDGLTFATINKNTNKIV